MRRFAILMFPCTVLLLGCGDGKKSAEELDLVGNRPATTSTPRQTNAKKQTDIKEIKETLSIDLLQDLVFRYQRDGWSLTTPTAHVTVEKLKMSGLDLILGGIPLVPGKSPAAALQSGMTTMEKLANDSGEAVAVARSYDHAKTIVASNRIALMMLIEGADAFEQTPSSIGQYKDKGILAVGLTAGRGNSFADAAVAPREHGGLTAKGKAFLTHCSDARIAVDLTHASATAFWDARAALAGAVLVSHTACRALFEHPRNLDDLQIIALGRFGGLMGLIFNPVFLAPGGEASLETVVAHIMHIKALGVIDALALGTDFGGIHPPRGLANVGDLDRLFDALLEQGLTAEEVKGIAGKNATRFFDEIHREFGAISHTEDEMLRPLSVECDSVSGESEGAPTSVCDHYTIRSGATLLPTSRHRIRLKDVISTPVSLEIYGKPDDPWQVEGQNLEGKILFHRFVKLDNRGVGSMGLPHNRNLTRLFLSPTRKSELKEAVVWGRPTPKTQQRR